MDLAENPFEDAPQTAANSSLMTAEAPVKFRFSKENSREMAARSRIARIQRQKEREEAARLATLKASLPATDPAEEKLKSRVQRINERIEAIIDEMETSESAKDTQALAMALDRLCGVWSLLTGHPRPGVRKDASKGRRMDFAKPSE